MPATARAGEEARSQELHLKLSCELQEMKYLGHYLLLSRTLRGSWTRGEGGTPFQALQQEIQLPKMQLSPLYHNSYSIFYFTFWEIINMYINGIYCGVSE